MALDRTLIQIRERNYLDILDLTMVVVRGRPRELGLAALAGILPFAVLNACLIGFYDIPFGLFFFLLLMEIPWATAPLTVVLGTMMFGDRPRARQVFWTIVRGLPTLFVYQFLLRGLLAITVLFYVVMPIRLAFLNEVVLLERGRYWGTMKRCTTLAVQSAGATYMYWFGQIAFGSIFLACFLVGTGAIVSSLTSSELTWETPEVRDLVGLRTQFALWVAIAFFAVCRFLTYIDQRIRLEGWEVKIRLQSVGRAIEEGGRW